MTDNERTLEALTVGNLNYGVEAMIARFERLVEEIKQLNVTIENHRHVERPYPLKTPYAVAVAEIQNKIMWSIANMNMGSLAHTAAEADLYRAQEQAERAAVQGEV